MAKLDAKAFGLACGIIWGGAMFSIGLVDMFTTWGDGIGVIMSTLYLGYAPTLAGSLIGGVSGLLDAGIGGFVLAWLYNRLAK